VPVPWSLFFGSISALIAVGYELVGHFCLTVTEVGAGSWVMRVPALSSVTVEIDGRTTADTGYEPAKRLNGDVSGICIMEFEFVPLWQLCANSIRKVYFG
jgi:hypothetical protein